MCGILIDEEEFRVQPANKLGIKVKERGGVYEWGQFWGGPTDYSIDEVLKMLGIQNDA